MLFNSLQFLVFFMVITLSYYKLKSQKSRVNLLLIASCYFYMSFVPKYILILGSTIAIDYVAGILISKSSGHARKTWLVTSIVANVGILVFYKYFNFLLGNIEPLLHHIFPSHPIPYINVILPIGLSFHTFQAMSYTIEVYRGKQPPERNFIVYALYVMFYPQLVAGPIERPQNILPQLHEYKVYDWGNVKEGLIRMSWGFFKKCVIADRLAMEVDFAYSHTGLSSCSLWLAALFYSFQIYCDFSGYCDIGIGAAKVMGMRLMENFNEPYRSQNISTFWSRWHISLSSWFRDYVYIPLGGNRLGETRRKLNVMFVFLLSGIWHGANWTFITWGTLHGMLTTFFPGRKKGVTGNFSNLVFVCLNFILVTLLWVFFRAQNISQALKYICGMFCFRGGQTKFGLNGIELSLSILLIIIMLVREAKFPKHFIKSDKAFAAYLTCMILICYFLGVFSENHFIYFQF